jgi:hypothetical protein
VERARPEDTEGHLQNTPPTPSVIQADRQIAN